MQATHRVLRRGKVFLLAVSACLLIACGPGASDTELVETAKKYLLDNQMREAALELKNALQVNPENAEARYLLGEIQLTAGDLQAAEKELRRSAELGWVDELVKIDLARTLILQRKFKEVIEGVAVGSGWSQSASADLLGLQAFAKASMGNMEQAKSLLAEAALSKNDALYVLSTQAQLHLVDANTAKAAEALAKAIKLYPDSMELYLLAAKVAIIDKDVALARKYFGKVMAAEPEKLITRNGRNARIGLTKLNILDRKFQQAHETLDPVVSTNDGDLEAVYLAAVLAFEEKNYDQAEIYLRNILKVLPDHEQTTLLFGTVSYAKKEFEQAVFYLGKYVSARPENAKAHKLLGRSFMALGQHEEAQAALRLALNEKSDDAELLALIGLSSLRSGRPQSGILKLEKAVSLSPKSSALRGELAKAYLSEGDTALAISELEKIIAGGEGAYRAQVMVVLAHLQDKKHDKAGATALKMLEQYPDDAAVMNLMGIVQHSGGDKNAARQSFEKALQINSQHVGAAINLARLDEKAGDIESAKKRYLAIAEDSADNVAAMMSLARLALVQNDKPSQIKWLEKVRAANKNDAASRIVLIEHLIMNDEFAEAEILLKELEAEHAGKSVVLVARTKLLIARESYNQAAQVIHQLIALNPEAAIGYYLKGLNKLKLQQLEDSKDSLLKAYKLEPDNVQYAALLAQVHLGSAEFEQALVLVKQIKKIAPERSLGLEIEGDANVGLQKYRQALQAYNDAWSIEPVSKLVLKRFQINRKINSNDKSYAVITDWLADNESDHFMRFKLAETYQQDGLIEQAVDEFKKILKMQPDNVIVLNNLAWILNKRDDPKQALEYAERAFKLNKSAAIKDTYGWILLKNNQTKRALSMLSEAYRDLPEVPDVKYHYAVALHKSGDKQAAYAMLEELLASVAIFDGRADARSLLNKKE